MQIDVGQNVGFALNRLKPSSNPAGHFSPVIVEIIFKALAALGLKVGGTVKQRADRLFLTK
ncbi:hypothetical protein ZOSMA_84G00100, partial [Zostera marina]